MLRGRLGSRRNKSYEDIHYSCTIRFLDDSEPISVTFQKETKGQWLIDHVCRELNLMEKDYFGLRYVDSDKQRHWLDPWKPVHKQLKHVEPMVLCFRVKFYPTDPMKLKEEITRYFLFLQLRRDLHHGRLLCSPADANQLAAYIIQSEVGDYDPQDHPPGYVNQFKMLPKQTTKQEEKIADIHKQMQNMVPAEAEGEFLKKSSSLDTYGVDPHPVKDQKGNQMYLGVTHLGIVTFQGNKRTHLFKWPQITKIAFEGKMFIVHVTISEGEENSLLVKRKKHACGFKCPTYSACKHLWKCAVEQQYFFTLQSAKDAPKVTSGGGLFTRGSKFRFSGRCQKEVYTESTRITRAEPDFVRSISNPQIVRSLNNLRSASLPSKLKEKNLMESNDVIIENQLNPQNNGPLIIEEEAEEGMPDQTPVKVSEVPYDPLQSPSSEDLPGFPGQEVIASSASPLPSGGSEQPAMGAEGAVPVDLDHQIHELTMELEKCKNENNLSGGDGEELLIPVSEAPLNAVSNLSSQQQVPASMSGESEHVANNIGSSTNHAHNNGLSDNAAGTTTTPVPYSPQLGFTCCKAVAFAFFFTFFVIGVIAIILLESEMEFPVLKDIRVWPEVQDFKSTHYSPFKATVMQKMGRWYKA